MTQIILKGTVKQVITRTADSKVYYIYQFQTMNNNDYIEIIDVYAKEKIPNSDRNSTVEIPINITLRNDGIFYELKTKNIQKDS
jgi:hypothetical protein